jgi:zinc transporter, ZIP family
MLDAIQEVNPFLQAGAAGIFAWVLSAAGAGLIFAVKGFNQKFFDSMLGFAAGVMIAAAFWSLLQPSIEMAASSGTLAWFPASLGFLLGTIFLRTVDKFLPHVHHGFPRAQAEGIKTEWPRSTLLVLAITLHNIPEGLALGVAVGAAASGFPEATAAAALALVLGIGFHNIPEGFAVSAAVRREGFSRLRSLWYGQLSAAVYPPAALIGLAAVVWAQALLPYALGFAGGAMIFVVVEEVIPESQRGGNTDLATAGTIIGFLGMMILDAVIG